MITNRVRQGVALLGMAVLISLLSGCDKEVVQNAPPPPEVSAAQVLIKPVSQWDNFNGRVDAVQRVQLRPRVSGYIEAVNYREGDEVRKGQVLFTIDDRSYRAALEQAKAELARARSQATLARSESGRSEKLIGTQAINAGLQKVFMPGMPVTAQQVAMRAVAAHIPERQQGRSPLFVSDLQYVG